MKIPLTCLLTGEDFAIWDRILNPPPPREGVSGWGYQLMAVRDARLIYHAQYRPLISGEHSFDGYVIMVRSNLTSFRRAGLER